MFGRDIYRADIARLIADTQQRIEMVSCEKTKNNETQRLASLYWALGEHCFRMFYKSMEWLYLTHAEAYFELAEDTLMMLDCQPSLFLTISRQAVEREKTFYGHDMSRDYVSTMMVYRTTPRVLEQEARHQHNPASDHSFFNQGEVKRIRLMPDAAHDLPGLEEPMDLDVNLFNWNNPRF